MTVTVEAGSSGIRLDSFVAESVDGLSRSGAQKLIEGGLVRSLGQCVKKNDKTVQGRSYDIDIPEPEPLEVLPQDIPLDIKVAVMGCVVNGPGEAKEADIGIAGGVGVGLLIKGGEIVKKVPEDQLLDTLREELMNWDSNKTQK